MSDTLFAIAGLSDDFTSLPTRAALLAGFLVLLFAVAGLAMLIGRRMTQRRNDRALSELTGQSKGASFADDAPETGDGWWGKSEPPAESDGFAAWQKAMAATETDELGGAPLPHEAPPAPAAAAPSYGRTRPSRRAVATATPAAAEAVRDFVPSVEPVSAPESEMQESPAQVQPQEVDEVADEPLAPRVTDTHEPVVATWTSTASSFDASAVREVLPAEDAASSSTAYPWEVDELADDDVSTVTPLADDEPLLAAEAPVDELPAAAAWEDEFTADPATSTGTEPFVPIVPESFTPPAPAPMAPFAPIVHEPVVPARTEPVQPLASRPPVPSVAPIRQVAPIKGRVAPITPPSYTPAGLAVPAATPVAAAVEEAPVFAADGWTSTDDAEDAGSDWWQKVIESDD